MDILLIGFLPSLKRHSRMLRPIWHRSLIANMRVPEAVFKGSSWQGFWIVWHW